jgi:type IV secretory pathway VirJ component
MTHCECWLFAVLTVVLAGPAAASPTLRVGAFGEVTLYGGGPATTRVVLYLDDHYGDNATDATLARDLGDAHTLVIDIDLARYLRHLDSGKSACAYPAGDLETVSQQVQKHLGLPRYIIPDLLGRGAGATLAYATLAQAPPNTFRSLLTLDFCPATTLARAPCRGTGLATRAGKHGYRVEPGAKLNGPWIVHAAGTAACDAHALQSFVQQTPGAREVAITGRPAAAATLAAVRQTLAQLTPTAADVVPVSDTLKDLPLVLVPAQPDRRDALVVIISGDGGWASIDREVADSLTREGFSVVGLNSLQYFWTRRTPDGAAHDLERILRYHLAAWHKQHALLIGYSRGADVLPFMAARLPTDLRAKIRLVALLGPAHDVEFEFHVQDWLSSGANRQAYPVRPEVEKLRGVPVLCLGGADEKDSLCPELDPTLATREMLKGGHHFGGDYTALSRIILQAAGEQPLK